MDKKSIKSGMQSISIAEIVPKEGKYFTVEEKHFIIQELISSKCTMVIKQKQTKILDLIEKFFKKNFLLFYIKALRDHISIRFFKNYK